MVEDFDATPDASEQHEVLAVLDPVSGEWVATEDSKPAPKIERRNGQAESLPPTRIAIEVDLLPSLSPPGYAPRVIDQVVLNTSVQRATLKAITATLAARQDKLMDGTRIQRPQQALQWLLEQFAVSMPSHVLEALIEGVQ